MTTEILLNSYNVHDHLKEMNLDELKAFTEADRLPFAVCVINIDGNLNIGMIIRTACLLGAERVIVYGKRHYDKRSCVGANNYIDIDRIGGLDFALNLPIEKFWEAMEKYDYCPVFIEQGGEDIRNMNVDKFEGKTPCLILGSESNGIDQEILEKAKLIYSIPQRGPIRSFNVSAAASIAMWSLSQLV